MDYTHNVRLNGQWVGKRWRYPSSGNCNSCHRGEEQDNPEFRGSLGFIPPQLNRVINGTNQLQTLVTRGVLTVNPVAGKPTAHRWYGLTEDSASLEKRVRSYFASNCSHCHNPKVALNGPDHDFDYFNPTKRIIYQHDSSLGRDPTGAWVNKPSASGGGFDFLLVPGHPESSAIMSKMKTRSDWSLDPIVGDITQMPPLATSQPDSAAVKLIEEWICSIQTGTSCEKIPWAPDETFWDSAVSVSMRPHGKLNNLVFQPSMRQGRLSIPAHIAASGKVVLRDYQGRKVDLVQEGKGEFRIPRTLTPGIYFLMVGQYRASLNYLP